MLDIPWEINTKNWHCSHSLGFSAFVDPQPTPSGAVRVLGPWVPNDVSKTDASEVLAELVFQIEELCDGQYVVFGGYSANARYQEHEFPIYSSVCGFVPSLAIRGAVTNHTVPEKEWVTLNMHRSGLDFAEPIGVVDKNVLHPLTIEGDLHYFCDQLTIDTRKVSEISSNISAAYR